MTPQRCRDPGSDGCPDVVEDGDNEKHDRHHDDKGSDQPLPHSPLIGQDIVRCEVVVAGRRLRLDQRQPGSGLRECSAMTPERYDESGQSPLS